MILSLLGQCLKLLGGPTRIIGDPYRSETLLRRRFDQLETAIAGTGDGLDLVVENLTHLCDCLV